MAWQKAAAIENGFVKSPVKGYLKGMTITPTEEERNSKLDEDGNPVYGREKLILFIEDETTQKERKVRLDLSNYSDKNWTRQEVVDEGGRPVSVWVAPSYSEYNSLKFAAEKAGSPLIEDIDEIEPEYVVPKKPLVQIFEVAVEEDIGCGFLGELMKSSGGGP